MRIIAENIANAGSTSRVAGGDPYRRQVPTFQEKLNRELGVETVAIGKPIGDTAEFKLKYMPGIPLPMKTAM